MPSLSALLRRLTAPGSGAARPSRDLERASWTWAICAPGRDEYVRQCICARCGLHQHHFGRQRTQHTESQRNSPCEGDLRAPALLF